MRWDNIIGHADIIQQLQAQLAAEKVPHALLFVGPEGIGKRIVAGTVAAALLCEAPDGRPCGLCRSCRLIEQQNHPDLLVVRPDGATLKISQIRELQVQAALAPYVGNRRVIIIDDAERMNTPAMNSLLKFLEEPPPGVIIMLIAASRHSLLTTILSRCRTIVFAPLAWQILAEALIERGNAPGQAEVAARLSGGQFGVALQLLSEGGFSARDFAADVLGKIPDGSMRQVWDTAAALDKKERSEVLDIIKYLEYLLRDIVVYKVLADQAILFNIDLLDRLIAWSACWEEQTLLKALAALQETRRSVQANANLRLAMEALLIRMHDFVQEDL